MIPALKLQGPIVAIRYQPANDGALASALALTHSLLSRDEARRPLATAPDYFGRPVEIDVLAPRDPARVTDRHEALLRKLVVEEAARVRLDLQPGEVAWRIQLFRDRFRLDSAAAMQAFLAHAGITFDNLASFFRAEALVERLEQRYEASVARELEMHRSFLAACAALPRRASGEGDAGVDAMMMPGPSEKALRRRVLLGILASREMDRRGAAAFAGEIAKAAEGFRVRFGLDRENELASWLALAGLGEGGFAQRLEELAAVAHLARESEAALEAGLRLGAAVRSVTTLPRRAAAS